MSSLLKHMQHYRPNEKPFENGEIVMVDHQFGNSIGGKYAVVEDCTKATEVCESGWMVKISTYPRPIDSNWLIKKP